MWLIPLLLDFPEMPDLIVNEGTFDKLSFGRKIQPYSRALEISKLLLLNYHPDVSQGENHVLALMFDMNILWEQFVYHALRKQILKSGKQMTIHSAQRSSKCFWQPDVGRASKIRPDIVINDKLDSCVVLDTKWKNLKGYRPALDDLRQMYVYHEYYHAKKAALMYPGDDDSVISGRYLDPIGNNDGGKECSIISIPVVRDDIRAWEEDIFRRFLMWIE